MSFSSAGFGGQASACIGKKFTDAVYKRTPEESYARVLWHLRKILPNASQEEIKRILR